MILLLTLNSTVWSQCIIHGKSSPDGCKAYTKQQRIECLKAFNDLLYADSTIIAKDSIISIQSNFIISTDKLVNELDQKLIQSNKDLDKINQGFKKIPKSWREEIKKGNGVAAELFSKQFPGRVFDENSLEC